MFHHECTYSNVNIIMTDYHDWYIHKSIYSNLYVPDDTYGVKVIFNSTVKSLIVAAHLTVAAPSFFYDEKNSWNHNSVTTYDRIIILWPLRGLFKTFPWDQIHVGQTDGL